MSTHDIELPPLPSADSRITITAIEGRFIEEIDTFRASTVEAYARQAVADDRQQRGEPVAWTLTQRQVLALADELIVGATTMGGDDDDGIDVDLMVRMPGTVSDDDGSLNKRPLLAFCLTDYPDEGVYPIDPFDLEPRSPQPGEPARVNADLMRNAAGILDTLTSKVNERHPLRVEAAAGAKQAVADLYRIADQIDAAPAPTPPADGQAQRPRLYQHDDGRYGLSFGPAAFAIGEPAWHTVPIDVVEDSPTREYAEADLIGRIIASHHGMDVPSVIDWLADMAVKHGFAERFTDDEGKTDFRYTPRGQDVIADTQRKRGSVRP